MIHDRIDVKCNICNNKTYGVKIASEDVAGLMRMRDNVRDYYICYSCQCDPDKLEDIKKVLRINQGSEHDIPRGKNII